MFVGHNRPLRACRDLDNQEQPPYNTIVLKVAKKSGMAIVQDDRQEVQKVGVLKINITTYEGGANTLLTHGKRVLKPKLNRQ